MKKYMNAAAWLLVLLIPLFIFNACHSHAPGEKDEHSHDEQAESEHHDEPENTTLVSLTADQVKAIDLQLGPVEQKNLNATLKANGYLRVPNQNKANAVSLYGGVVRSLPIQPGATVRAGQAVATITNPQFITLQEEYLTLASRITLAELEYTRQKDLNAGNAGALKNLQQVESELAALRTRRASLRRQLELMGIAPEKISDGNLLSTLSVRSPLSGVVSNIPVRIGSYVDANTPVAEIVDNGQLHLDLSVYEKDLPRLRNNQIIHFTLTNNPGKEYDATIYSIGTAFEQDTKTIPVHAQVKGDKTGLIEGMSITAVVSLGKATVPAVPVDAIVTQEGQDFIFIRTEKRPEQEHADEESDHPEETFFFEKIPVHRGTTDIGYAEITPVTELPKNAQVVVKGAFFLLAKMNNKGEAHAH